MPKNTTTKKKQTKTTHDDDEGGEAREVVRTPGDGSRMLSADEVKAMNAHRAAHS